MEQDTRAWYRKYRPSDLSNYIGEDIRRIVENRFTKAENRPQVIMVQGERGCGKTTFARLISKYYLCENQVNGHPCEVCEICTEINEKLINGEAGTEIFGVKEIDATIVNGKEAIQEVMEDALMAPMYTKKKIIIFDEVHRASKAAQSSLLKLIEDIPPFLVCIFATTDPQMVLPTILSRCNLKLEVKKKTVDEMADRLLYIAQKENLVTSKEALKIIAKKADRVPREAINLLEHVAKTYGNQVTVESVRRETGDVSSELYMDYFEAAHESLDNILNYNKKLKGLDIAYKEFMSGLTRFSLDALYIRHGISIEDYTAEYVKKVKKLFEYYNTNEFDTLLEVLESAARTISEDDNRNELTVTTTALRIGKLNILSTGLKEEFRNAEKENKKSIKEYKDMLKEDTEESNSKISTIGTTKEALVSLLNLREIKGTENTSVQVPLDTDSVEPEKKQDTTYLSQEEILRLMNE